MKPYFLITLLCFSTQIFAQNGFYLQPSFGAGISNSNYTDALYYGSKENIFTYCFNANVAYHFRHWQFTTGIAYLKTGYKVTGDDIAGASITGFNSQFPTIGNYEVFYSHLLLPFKAGYSLNLGKKMSIIPYAGLEASYNLNRLYKITSPAQAAATRTDDMKYFNIYYNAVSVFGIAGGNLSYKLRPGLSLLCGIEAQYMLTSLVKKKYGNGDSYLDHAITFNTGISVALSKKAPVKKAN
jgi:hypothetical protein